MGRLCYSLLGVKWKMCWGTRRATSVGLRRPIAERPREMVRKLSPYDVFPPSQRRFRRDTRGSQESYDSVGVMENRGGKQWESSPRRERERERESESKEKECAVEGGESVRGAIFTPARFICLWHHANQGDLTSGRLNEHEEINRSFFSIKCQCVTLLTYLYHAPLLFPGLNACTKTIILFLSSLMCQSVRK